MGEMKFIFVSYGACSYFIQCHGHYLVKTIFHDANNKNTGYYEM